MQLMAQQKEVPSFSKGLYWEFSGLGGRMIKNYPDFPEHGLSAFASITMARQTYGRSIWNQWYNYPKTGLILSGGGFGNHEVFGENISIQAFIGLDLVKHPKFSFETKISMGFAFFNKPYDYVENPENTVIGSRITNITQLSFSAYIPLNTQWEILTGFSMMHYSDGHTRLPNLGANIPLIQAGLRYRPQERPEIIRLPDTLPMNHKYLMNIEAAYGWHEFGETMGPVNGPKYSIYSIGINLQKRFGKIHMLSVGAYWNYYTSFFDFITSQDFYKNNAGLHSSTFILYFGHEFIIGHLGLLSQIGFYLHNDFRKDYTEKVEDKPAGFKTINTNKLGVKYYFKRPTYSLKNNFYLGLNIKANAGQADFVEFTTGFSF